MCGSRVAVNMHSNYYYMVEGSPYMWQLTCMVITRIWWRGPLTCGQLTCTVLIYLKIPACESQHCLQSKLSQTHSYHGVKRHTECCTLTVHGSHTLIKIPTLNAAH